MTEETQKELIEAAKKALKIVATVAKRKDRDFVFYFRDLIRKCEEKDAV